MTETEKKLLEAIEYLVEEVRAIRRQVPATGIPMVPEYIDDAASILAKIRDEELPSDPT